MLTVKSTAQAERRACWDVLGTAEDSVCVCERDPCDLSAQDSQVKSTFKVVMLSFMQAAMRSAGRTRVK